MTKGYVSKTAMIAVLSISGYKYCASFTSPKPLVGHKNTYQYTYQGTFNSRINKKSSLAPLNGMPSEERPVKRTVIDKSLTEQYPNDYLITDSTFLQPESRPPLFQALSNPRDIVAIPTIIVGAIVSIFNVSGTYNEQYQQLEIVAIALGFLSTFAYMFQLITEYKISPNIRCGIIDDATVNLYALAYTGVVSWLALRTCDLCPSWLQYFDGILPILSVFVFMLSLLAPYLTLFGGRDTIGPKAMVFFARSFSTNNDEEAQGVKDILSDQFVLPELSPTELLRARGLLAIGVLGCVFAPDALSFALGGQEWWDRVYQMHPSQRYLESSTSLFALFSVEACMISHRVGKTGAACYQDIVPAFAVVCLVLAIAPCISALHWLGNDISFFSFYRE